MKNKRKQVRSYQKQVSIQSKSNKNNNKGKRAEQSVSVFYESARNSLGNGSPRPNKAMQKYKTYIQFITNNKITNDTCQINKQELAALRKTGATPVLRKNSPIPYSKGRRSAFSKLTQPTSPTNVTLTQRSSFSRSQPHGNKKQNNPHLAFVIKGSNVENSKLSSAQVSARRKIDEIQKQFGHKRHTSREEETSDGGQFKYAKGLKKNVRNNDKTTEKRGEIKKLRHKGKNSAQHEYNQKLDKEEAKLCDKLFQGIQFYRDLGRGAHALVRSAVDWNNKRKIAVKIYEKSELTEEEVRSIRRQIEILKSLTHPNIIGLYQRIQTYKTINLIMEYGGGNSLDQYIKSKTEGYLSQSQARLIFKQVLDAVRYLHEMNITHRDIKSENILLNKHLNLKIIDFGFSLVVGQNNKQINSYCGTPTYMAPEVVSKTPHNPQLADRWSLGILLFVMLNGQCPFRASTQKELFTKIIKGQYQYLRHVNPLAKDLISKLLVKDPQQRLSPKQALLHPWIINN